jgi:hypothetical protein
MRSRFMLYDPSTRKDPARHSLLSIFLTKRGLYEWVGPAKLQGETFEPLHQQIAFCFGDANKVFRHTRSSSTRSPSLKVQRPTSEKPWRV